MASFSTSSRPCSSRFPTMLLVAIAVCSACAGQGEPGAAAPPATGATTTSADSPRRLVSISSHCGLTRATFDGRVWTAAPARPEPRPVPDASGVTSYTGHTSGDVETIGPDRLRFTFPDPDAVGGVGTVIFVPAPEGEPEPAPCA